MDEIKIQSPLKIVGTLLEICVFLEKYNQKNVIEKLNTLNIKYRCSILSLLHNQPLFKDCNKILYPNAEKLSKNIFITCSHVN